MVPYLVGAVTAPLVGAVIKPIVRGTVKTTISIALEMKRLAAEAAEDVQDLAAEASADFVAAETAGTQAEFPVTAPKTATRPGVTTPKKV
ncbi:MAG: DUF5132 domain-containing protein [Mycobacteriales bacterium]